MLMGNSVYIKNKLIMAIHTAMSRYWSSIDPQHYAEFVYKLSETMCYDYLDKYITHRDYIELIIKGRVNYNQIINDTIIVLKDAYLLHCKYQFWPKRRNAELKAILNLVFTILQKEICTKKKVTKVKKESKNGTTINS